MKPNHAPRDGSTARAAPAIAPVVVPKASDVLAARLREMITRGRFAPGEMLPAERDLVAETQLSRTSVREALRVLEAEGLIVTRAGRAGGSKVTLPARAAVARSVETFVRAHGVRLESLLDCRVAVEPTLARLAARHRTAAELDEMNRLHAAFATAAVDDVPAYKAINLEWHLAVARASRNEPLLALMEAISTPIRDAMDYQHVTTAALRALAVKAHAGILRAIAEGDGEGAARRMEQHVAGYRAIAIERGGGDRPRSADLDNDDDRTGRTA